MTPTSFAAHGSESNGDTAAEVTLLNGAIVTLLDNVDEYRRATFALEQKLSEFQLRIHSRMQAVESLQTRVRQLGAQPVTSRSLLAAAFAGMLSMRQSFLRNQEQDLLDDAERGERSLLSFLRRALSKTNFSEATQDCLRRAVDAVTNPHQSVATADIPWEERTRQALSEFGASPQTSAQGRAGTEPRDSEVHMLNASALLGSA